MMSFVKYLVTLNKEINTAERTLTNLNDLRIYSNESFIIACEYLLAHKKS